MSPSFRTCQVFTPEMAVDVAGVGMEGMEGDQMNSDSAGSHQSLAHKEFPFIT